MRIRTVSVLLIAASLPLVAACAPHRLSAPRSAAPAGAGGELAGPTWTLTELNGQPPADGRTITARFGPDGSLSGSDGCNNYRTTFTVDGSTIDISDQIISTQMACPEPTMQQAAAYYAALGAAASFQVSGMSLMLMDAGGNTVAAFTSQGSTLPGTSWILTGYNNGRGGLVSVLADTTATANFGKDGRLSGSDGCNNYTTTYTADGGRISIREQIATTMMACEEAIMQQASEYLKALPTAATYEISGDMLTLRDASGAMVATYAAQSQELAGTSWRVTGYNNGKQAVVSVIIGTEITAQFGADGVVSGVAGCNNYSAPYQAQNGTITVGQGAVTMKACVEPEGIMEQESQYLAALQSAATYRIDGGKLELRRADGALAVTYVSAAP